MVAVALTDELFVTGVCAATGVALGRDSAATSPTNVAAALMVIGAPLASLREVSRLGMPLATRKRETTRAEPKKYGRVDENVRSGPVGRPGPIEHHLVVPPQL